MFRVRAWERAAPAVWPGLPRCRHRQRRFPRRPMRQAPALRPSARVRRFRGWACPAVRAWARVRRVPGAGPWGEAAAAWAQAPFGAGTGAAGGGAGGSGRDSARVCMAATSVCGADTWLHSGRPSRARACTPSTTAVRAGRARWRRLMSVIHSAARHPQPMKPARPKARDSEQGPTPAAPPRSEAVVPLPGGRREATQGV